MGHAFHGQASAGTIKMSRTLDQLTSNSFNRNHKPVIRLSNDRKSRETCDLASAVRRIDGRPLPGDVDSVQELPVVLVSDHAALMDEGALMGECGCLNGNVLFAGQHPILHFLGQRLFDTTGMSQMCQKYRSRINRCRTFVSSSAIWNYIPLLS